MTGVPEGLGAVIMDGRNLSRTDLVIAGMIGAIVFEHRRLRRELSRFEDRDA
jgi:ABC-type nitrate/sulfonate/bicarbonate transport system permease component